MTSGRDILHHIDRFIADARQTASATSKTVADDARALAQIDKTQVEVFRRLADIRIDLLRDDENKSTLGTVDRKAEDLIDNHQSAVDRVNNERADAEKEIEQLEQKRRAQENIVEETVSKHEQAVAATRARLLEDPDYQNRVRVIEEADAIANRAAQKLDTARETRVEKGAPYEKDPLFSYLWARKFATKEYKAFPLFAILDRWVAGIIDYRDAQLNYRRLLELPERFSEHAARVDEVAVNARQSLEEFERDALKADGVDRLRDEADAAADALSTIDDALATAEAAHLQLIETHDGISSGQTGPLEEARMLLAKALSKLSVPDLKILAAETISLDDDHLVEELIDLKRERMELEENQNAGRRDLTQRNRNLSQLEDIRRKFKRARYDSPYSEFKGRGLINKLVEDFLEGYLSGDDFWHRLRRAHRTRRREWSQGYGGEFGGRDWRGGFSLPDNIGGARTGSSRHTPRTRRVKVPRSSRSPRRPRAPRVRFPKSRGRGGFKTGGGF